VRNVEKGLGVVGHTFAGPLSDPKQQSAIASQLPVRFATIESICQHQGIECAVQAVKPYPGGVGLRFVLARNVEAHTISGTLEF
jgi:hypothetical protein